MTRTARMPFGKYKGRSLSDVPHDYLFWALKHVHQLDSMLRIAIMAELGLTPRVQVTDARPAVAALENSLKAWYERMSLKYHPDRGGSDQAQIIVNDCYESMRAALGQIGGSL